MNNIPYTPPGLDSAAFNCPLCKAYARQEWCSLVLQEVGEYAHDYRACRCGRCEQLSMWRGDRMIYPDAVVAPPPNADLSDEIKTDFEEARIILSRSPRGAAALLRLCIQKLCWELGAKEPKINDAIGSLVRKGLDPRVQQSLDIVRVVGNNAVHPGQLDLRDDADTANKLFGLVNLIAEIMITQPKHIAEAYQSLVPEAQQKAIARRDSK